MADPPKKPSGKLPAMPDPDYATARTERIAGEVGGADVFSGYYQNPGGRQVFVERTPYDPPQASTVKAVKTPQYLQDIERLFPGRLLPALPATRDIRRLSEPVYGFELGAPTRRLPRTLRPGELGPEDILRQEPRPSSGRSASRPRRVPVSWIAGATPVEAAQATPLTQKEWIQAYAATTGNKILASMLANAVTKDPTLREIARNAYENPSPDSINTFNGALRNAYPEFYDDAIAEEVLRTKGLRTVVTTEHIDAMGRLTNNLQLATDKLYRLAMDVPGSESISDYRTMKEEIHKSQTSSRPALARAIIIEKKMKIALTEMPAKKIKDPAIRAEALEWEKKVREAMAPLDKEAADSAMRQLKDKSLLLAKVARGQVVLDDSIMDALDLWSEPTRLKMGPFPRTVVSEMGDLDPSGSGSTPSPYYPEQMPKPAPEKPMPVPSDYPPGDVGVEWAPRTLGTEEPGTEFGPGGSAMDIRTGLMEGQKSWPPVPWEYDQSNYDSRMVVAAQYWVGDALRRAMASNSLGRAQEFWQFAYWQSSLPRIEFTDKPRQNARMMLEAIISDPEVMESVGPNAISKFMEQAGLPHNDAVLRGAYGSVIDSARDPVGTLEAARRYPTPRQALDGAQFVPAGTLIQAAAYSQTHANAPPEDWVKFGRTDSFGAAAAEAAIKSGSRDELTRAKAAITAVGGPAFSDINIPAVSEYGTFMNQMQKGSIDAAAGFVWQLGRGEKVAPLDKAMVDAAAQDSKSFRPGDRSIAEKPNVMLQHDERYDTPSYAARLDTIVSRNKDGTVSANNPAMEAWYDKPQNSSAAADLYARYPKLTEGQRIAKGIAEGMIAEPIDSERYVQHQIAKKFISEVYRNIMESPWTEEKRIAVINRLQNNGFALPDWMKDKKLRDKYKQAEEEEGTSFGDYIRGELAKAPDVIDPVPAPSAPPNF